MKKILILCFLVLACKNELGFKTTERAINDPSDVPNMLFWFDANDVLGNGTRLTNGANVNTNWVDKSGLNQTINLLTGTSPTVVHDFLNDLDVVDFGGAGAISGNFLTNFTLTKFTALMVMRMESATPAWGGGLVISRAGINDFDNDGTACILIREGAANTMTGFRNGVRATSSSSVMDSWHLFTQYYRAGNEMVFRLDGVEVGENVFPETAFNSSKFTIGGRLAPGEGFFLNGQVAEVLFYQGELNPAHLEAIENYLMLKWGL